MILARKWKDLSLKISVSHGCRNTLGFDTVTEHHVATSEHDEKIQGCCGTSCFSSMPSSKKLKSSNRQRSLWGISDAARGQWDWRRQSSRQAEHAHRFNNPISCPFDVDQQISQIIDHRRGMAFSAGIVSAAAAAEEWRDVIIQ